MNTYLKKFLWLLVSLIVLYILAGLLILGFSPMITKHFAGEFLAEHNVVISENSIVQLNVFSSKIVIKEAVLLKQADERLRINELTLHYLFLPLFRKHIIVEKISLAGATLHLKRHDNDFTAAGLSLEKLLKQTKSESEEDESAETDKKPSQITFSLKSLEFTDIQIKAYDRTQLLPIYIDKFTLKDFEVAPQGMNANMQGMIKLADGNINFETHFQSSPSNKQLKLSFIGDRINLEEISNWLGSGQNFQRNFLDISFNAEGNFSEDYYSLNMKSLSFNLDVLDENNISDETRYPDIQVAEINLPKILSDKDKGEISIELIDILAPQIDLTLDSTITETSDETRSTKASNTKDKISSKKEKEKKSKVSKQTKKLSDSDVNTDSSPKPTNETITISKTENPAINIKIGKIIVSNPGHVELTDLNTETPFTQKFHIQELEILDIDSSDPQKFSHFKFQGKDENYFGYSFEGKVTPFTPAVNLKVKGKTSELDLPPINTYLQKNLGLTVEHGQMDSDISLTIDENKLDGQLKLHLKAIKFSSTNEKDHLSAIDQSAVPLNVALNYLKDKNGNIELKIPLSGNLTDPNFSIRHLVNLVIKKAAMNQAKSYLISTFIPYSNVLKVAMIAGEHALKVRFEDLHYEAKQIAISEDQTIYMDELAVLLKDKKDLRIHVCPYAAKSDGEDRKEQALIAEARAKNFKDYLINEKQIASARILICEVKFDIREGASPRIEIGE